MAFDQIQYLASQLDSYAQNGANTGSDPSFPSTLTGGAPITYGGSIWAGGLTWVLEADYYWMYDDGYSGSSTSERGLRLVELVRLLGSPRHHVAPLRQLSGRRAHPVDGCRVVLGRLLGRLHRGHLCELVLAADRHHRQLRPVGRLGRVRHRHRGRSPWRRLPNGHGYWETESNGTVAALGSAQSYGSLDRSAQLAHRGHGLDPGRQGLLARRCGRWHLQLR